MREVVWYRKEDGITAEYSIKNVERRESIERRPDCGK
jgi:hypothetical protein